MNDSGCNHRWVFLYAEDAYMCDRCKTTVTKHALLTSMGAEENYAKCLDRLANNPPKEKWQT